jgi:anaerobic magnesium-protoporphyrin IX monomethyl ester cyclase
MHKRDSVDLVLVNPGNLELIYQSLASDLSAIEPPVWAGLMATFVRRKGHSVAIVDANAERLTPEETAVRVSDFNPTLTAVVVYGHQPSASTQNMTASGAVCSAIKQAAPELKLMLVGGHVAALPQRTLEEEDIDFVSDGEGLYTMIDLLQCLQAGGGDLDKVRGLLYWEGDVVRRTLSAPLFRELDSEMPGIAWDLLPMERYRAHNWHCLDTLQRQPYVALYTTLGCPYHCNFCCIQAPFKSGEKEVGIKESINSYRFWSPDAVIREIDLLVNEYGVRNIKIADEMFVLNRKHIEGICDRIIERGYDLNIWAYARVDTVKDGMVDKLKRAGFNWLAFGIEAANDRVRSDVQKGFGQELIYETLNNVRGADINIIGNYIFGLPEDDIVTMQETLDMAIELNCEFANFYCAMAYPGSELYGDATRENWALPKEWNDFSQHATSTLPLPTKYLKASEVLRFRDHAFHAYFTSPSYLNMIEKRFGIETMRHIQKMTEHKLERDILQETTN